MHARALAATVVSQVLDQGRSLSDILPAAIARLTDASERGLLQELGYGVLRWYPQLAAVARVLLHKPPKRKDRDLYALVLVGLYQLIHLRVAPHAAVSLSVAAADELGKSWAKGWVNAVLRAYQRDPQLLQRVASELDAQLAHPAWLLAQLQRDWPEHWQAIAAAANARPPMTLRVNRARTDRAAYLAQLRTCGLLAREHEFAPDALVLEAPVDVLELPGFKEGLISIQDAAAQLAALLVDARAGDRVLDACAAPGGKTAHILECRPGLAELVAVEIDAGRMGRVRDNLQRLGLSAELVVADAAAPGSWWDGRSFDRVLLDAPCSATGVIRRHPDIKVLRRAEDVDGFATQQQRLLAALWPLLRPGGTLVYATCSVLRQENETQMQRFLATYADAREIPIEAPWGRPCAIGRQILPGESDMDGFYYACVCKR
jgi:16S rRNA (cytosine967-C5)-methyltransferase